ncbi:MAG TPA: hypothetical protein VFB00_09805, partial [Terriglobales bacterium]|nr:hypothetical protein [Terriglobales bacterium]
YANLRVNGSFRRFLVHRMGSTGSAWLAKLLNSHPDVFCSHEGVIARVYPAQDCTENAIFDFVEFFSWDTKHEAYRAVGDVGSVWTGHVAYLPFTTALLTRHPARLLRTRLSVYPGDQSFTSIPHESAKCIREIWGIDLNAEAPVDRMFLNDLLIFTSQACAFEKTDMVMRIEDLQDVECCRRTLSALTGQEYDGELVAESIERRINQRSGLSRKPISEVVSAFSPRQRDWYQSILRDVVPYLGYELLEEADDPSWTESRVLC